MGANLMTIPVLGGRQIKVPFKNRGEIRRSLKQAREVSRLKPQEIAQRLKAYGPGLKPCPLEYATTVHAQVCSLDVECQGQRGCLLRSIAITIYCARQGYGLTWCSGFALNPFRAHAWVETGGTPIGENPEVKSYQRVLSLALSEGH